MTDFDKLLQMAAADTISDEMLAAYIDGNATDDEIAQIESSAPIDELDEITDIVEDSQSIDDIIHFYDGDYGYWELGIPPVLDINDDSNHLINNDMDSNIYVADGHIGDINLIQQAYNDTCAIKSQQLILNDFGIPCTEDDLVLYSYEHGWYNGNGTLIPDIGNLIESAGIPVTRQTNANVFNIVNELAQGHKIIVGVDSDELWHNDSLFGKLKNWLSDFFLGDQPDHALIVAGIDTSDPNNIQVIVTDPGSGDHWKAYPIDQFMDAWSDASCYMVSTDIAVPQTTQGMMNFNPEIGHLDTIAGVPYTDFQIFNDMSYGLPAYVPMNSEFFSPIDSFAQSYFDYAHHNIGYLDIFNGNYMEFMSPKVVVPLLHDTYHTGLTQIDFNSSNDWNQYASDNGLSIMTNEDYSSFLSQSLIDFQAMDDVQSIMYCQQQQMMLDFCDNFGLDFYNDIYL